MPTSFEDITINYPMPAWCVPHVTQLLTTLSKSQSSLHEHGQPGTPDALSATPIRRGTESDWTVRDLEHLKPLILNNKVAMAMLDLAASNAGKFVTFPDACEKAGIDLSRGRSGIGALTKVCNKIGKKGAWPVSYQWAGNGQQVACYTMNEDIATKWQQVRGE